MNASPATKILTLKLRHTANDIAHSIIANKLVTPLFGTSSTCGMHCTVVMTPSHSPLLLLQLSLDERRVLPRNHGHLHRIRLPALVEHRLRKPRTKPPRCFNHTITTIRDQLQRGKTRRNSRLPSTSPQPASVRTHRGTTTQLCTYVHHMRLTLIQRHAGYTARNPVGTHNTVVIRTHTRYKHRNTSGVQAGSVADFRGQHPSTPMYPLPLPGLNSDLLTIL